MNRLSVFPVSVAFALATVSLVSCSSRKVPEDTGGERLPGIDRIDSSQPGFLMSPSGEWLLFESGTDFEPHFVLYDLAARTGLSVRNPEADKDPTQQGLGPRLRRTRWSIGRTNRLVGRAPRMETGHNSEAVGVCSSSSRGELSRPALRTGAWGAGIASREGFRQKGSFGDHR